MKEPSQSGKTGLEVGSGPQESSMEQVPQWQCRRNAHSLIPGLPPYTVHCLLLAVQALRCLDEAADWVNGEVLPVTVARRLQEAVADCPVETFVIVCSIDFIHIGT